MFDLFHSKDTPKPTKNSEGLTEYQAFDAKDRSKRLRIKSINAPAHSPLYRLLLNVSYDDKDWTSFVLTYSFMQVQITGKNLQNVIIAIENDGCAFIQEFDQAVFAQPNPAEPFIEKIEFVVKA